MPIKVTCACGKVLKAPDHLAGKQARCPGCGSVLQVPPDHGPIDVKPIAQVAPIPTAVPVAQPVAPSLDVAVPAAPLGTPVDVPAGLRSPGLPPCRLSLSMAGALVEADFDVTPVLAAFVGAFAKKLRKRYDVQIGPVGPDVVPNADVRVARINQGSRMLRYMFTFLAGKTCMEVTGTVTGETVREQPFQFKHRCSVGLFGGNSLGLLKLDARNLGTKVAKAVLRACR